MTSTNMENGFKIMNEYLKQKIRNLPKEQEYYFVILSTHRANCDLRFYRTPSLKCSNPWVHALLVLS